MNTTTIQRLSETEREVAHTNEHGVTRHELVDDEKGRAELLAPGFTIEEVDQSFPGEGDVRMLLAKNGDGKIVGSVRVRSSTVFVATFAGLFVERAHRGKGVAKMLIARAEQIARDDLGCCALSACVKPHNLIARKVYAKLGYAVAFHFEDDDLLVSKPVRPLHVGIPEPIGGAS